MSSTSITLAPVSDPSIITIDGEQYSVCYQTMNSKGKWENRSISETNTARLEGTINLIFLRSTREICQRKAAEDDIALSFENHEFTDLAFSTSKSTTRKPYKTD